MILSLFLFFTLKNNACEKYAETILFSAESQILNTLSRAIQIFSDICLPFSID